jgi:hypothetical protein
MPIVIPDLPGYDTFRRVAHKEQLTVFSISHYEINHALGTAGEKEQ